MSKTHKIAVIPGDGIGKEVMPEALRALEAASKKFGFRLDLKMIEWASCDYYAQHGQMMPDDWKAQLEGQDAILFGAVGWPATVPDHVSLWGSLLKFRREFDQYINLRPVRLFEGVPCPLAGRKPGEIDFLVVRENTEGEYTNLGGVMYAGTEREVVSIRNLLQMASGLEFGLFADNISMFLAMDMTQRALDNPLAKPPLTDWEYNNHGVQVLEPVLRGATGLTAEEYSQLHLWQPMGMDAEWLKDDVGHPAMYMNVLASCRDHARFGYLYLHDGCWDGEELVSEGFIDDARSPSQQLNRGYGYLWWLSGQEPTLDSVDFKPKPGGLHPFGPDDSYCAVGLGNQVIEVIPSHDMVMVRMGTAPMDDPEKWLTPLQLLDEVLEDGKQLIHNQVLELVLDAVVE